MKKLIGIEIGGSNVRFAVFERPAKPVYFKKIRTPRTLRALIIFLRKELSAFPSEEIAGVGIGTAGSVAGTRVINSTNIPYFRNFDFKKIWGGRLAVQNDAQAFGRFEAWIRKSKNRIFAVTLGTGIGRSFAAEGKVKMFGGPELWEKDYQKFKNTRNSHGLAIFLAERLAPLISKYEPELTVIGGGAAEYPGLFKELKRLLRKEGLRGRVEKPRSKEWGPAWGACLPLIK